MIGILIQVIIFWIIGMILSLYIHELGHVTVGVLHRWKLFCLMTGLDSLAIGIINLVPSKLRTGLYYNDGTRSGRIRNGGVPAQEEAAIMHIIEKSVLYGDDAVYETEECAPLTGSSDPIYQYYGYFVLYGSALQHNRDAANAYRNRMEQLSKTVPKAVINMFPMDDNGGAIS